MKASLTSNEMPADSVWSVTRRAFSQFGTSVPTGLRLFSLSHFSNGVGFGPPRGGIHAIKSCALLGFGLLAFGLLGCMANGPAEEEDVGIAKSASSETGGATEVNLCRPTECSENADFLLSSTGNTTGSYTRSSFDIVTTCGDTRPFTVANLDLNGQQAGYDIRVDIGTLTSNVWGGVTTSAECDESFLDGAVLVLGGSGQNDCGYSTLGSIHQHGNWVSGECVGPTFSQTVSNGHNYRAHVQATRFDGSHRTVTIQAFPH